MLDDHRLDECYDRLLAGIGDACEAIGPGRLTSHWPLVGGAFDHGVLVIGQAVYGWVPDWTATEAATTGGRAAIIEASRNVFADLADPMGWIAGHRVENTPFWRTAHEVADALTPGPGPWYSRVAWANLYPVAPNEYKGNPVGICGMHPGGAQRRGWPARSYARLIVAHARGLGG